MVGDGRAGHEGVTGGQIGRHVGRVVRGGLRPGSPVSAGSGGWWGSVTPGGSAGIPARGSLSSRAGVPGGCESSGGRYGAGRVVS
jgi:hypothetical protein